MILMTALFGAWFEKQSCTSWVGCNSQVAGRRDVCLAASGGGGQ